MSTKKEINLSLGIGIILTILGVSTSNDALLLLGNVSVMFSCYLYSELKGYSRILGIFLGLFFNVLGFIVLALLRDKNKQNKNSLPAS